MSGYNWNNFVLYIKRAELNHDEEYIKNALEIIGNVKSVSFIGKTNEKGQQYNGVIVYFNNMYIGDNLYQMVEEFETNKEKTAKIYHNEYRYWIVHEYINHSVPTMITSNINVDNNEELVFEYKLLQKRCERQEQQMMEYEDQLMQKWFENIDLQLQVDKKDCYLEWKKREIEEQKENYDKKINENENKIYNMQLISDENYYKIISLENELTNKTSRIEYLEQDLELVNNMLAYYEQKYGSYIDIGAVIM
jgi:hypothetical protein